MVNLIRESLEAQRARVKSGGEVEGADAIAAEVAGRIGANWVARPLPVINATGVILHTNLGRAPLSQDAVRAMQAVSAYSDLEYDVPSGERGSRQDHVAAILRSLTGCDSGHVTVNNAAAVLLVVTALARGKDVLVSRGEAVEIGGGFRVPVILRQSGARLIEVGTTNRTRLQDFVEGITERTAAILQVHSSNFRLVGFTERVELSDLGKLARERGIPLIVDNGSGALLRTEKFGLAHEPMPQEALEAGALVTFSGDKLLGGPQAGIILGPSALLTQVRKHPLSRVVRPDKATLAALAATLLSYLRGDAERTLPVWQMIAQSPDAIRTRALGWQRKATERGIEVELTEGESTVGGGSLPGETLPTTLVLLPRRIRAERLRLGEPAVVARSRAGRAMFDLRTVPVDQEDVLVEAVSRALATVDGQKKRVLDSATK